jgi:COP9 signalosome complex subunit 2
MLREKTGESGVKEASHHGLTFFLGGYFGILVTQEYDFDYEDDDQEDVDTDMENKYYQAKNYKTDNPEKALADWRSIVETENPKGEWGFKALKQSTKLNFHRGNYQEALKVEHFTNKFPSFPQILHNRVLTIDWNVLLVSKNIPSFRQTYTELLDYCQSAVTRNAAEKAINGILDYVGAAQDLDTSLMQQWYEVTQNALQAAKNDVSVTRILSPVILTHKWVVTYLLM